MSAVMNVNNFGILNEARLVKDPFYFQNRDNSESVAITVAVRRNFPSGEEKTYESDFVELRAYVPKGTQHHGIFGFLQTGDKVSIQYSIRSSVSDTKDGKRYFQTLFIENLSIAEGKKVREERRAAKAQSAS